MSDPGSERPKGAGNVRDGSEAITAGGRGTERAEGERNRPERERREREAEKEARVTNLSAVWRRETNRE